MVRKSPSSDLPCWSGTLTGDYTGALNTSILDGILSLLDNKESTGSLVRSIQATRQRHGGGQGPLTIRFFACVRSANSAERVKSATKRYSNLVTVLISDNIRGATEADVVILGCKPNAAKALLGSPGMVEALEGKLMVSVLGGLSVGDLENMLYDTTEVAFENRCIIARAMPNVASSVAESMTIIPVMPQPIAQAVIAIFSCVGRVKTVPSDLMDPATAMCASGPAFFAYVLEALIQGVVNLGISRADAVEMAAQTMKGTAQLILRRETPESLKTRVATPGGATEKGLAVLHTMKAQEAFEDALKETSNAMVGLSTK